MIGSCPPSLENRLIWGVSGTFMSGKYTLPTLTSPKHPVYFSASQILLSLRKLRLPPTPKLSPALCPSTVRRQRDANCAGSTMLSCIWCHAPSATVLSLMKASSSVPSPLCSLTSRLELSNPRQKTSVWPTARNKMPFSSRVRMSMVMLVTGLSKELLVTNWSELSWKVASVKPVEGIHESKVIQANMPLSVSYKPICIFSQIRRI